MIVPVERDFQRITKDDLMRMYEEVTVGAERFARLLKAFAIPERQNTNLHE